MKRIKTICIIAIISLAVVFMAACRRDNNGNTNDDAAKDQPTPTESVNEEEPDKEPTKEPVTNGDENTGGENQGEGTDETGDNGETGGNSDENQENTLLSPEDARQIIEDRASLVIDAISRKDGAAISQYVHPVKGVRFTPYAFVSLEDDVAFTKEQMENFFENTGEYMWGYYDGTGDEIRLTPGNYYEKFIYTHDFKNAPQVGYNELLSYGNSLENQFEVYESPIVVEYYFPGTDPEYDGLDWSSLRLVFEEYEGEWMLVGIIHNQWTI